MWEAVPRVFAAFHADEAIRAIVLTGAGDKAFVSGADISQFESQRSSEDAVRRYEEIGDAAQSAIRDSDKPVLAMIRGYCIGGGLNIANCCDLRVASDDARFAIPAAKMGLGYRPSSMKLLVDAVGPANAREIMLTARQFTAGEAKQMGLVHHVVPVAEIEAFTKKLCEDISANAPLTMKAAKRIIREVSRTEPDVELCKALVKDCMASEDYKEGRRAFMEKRKPRFKGR
jgi:enoyl-CoA hydratase/carnithine racemase